MLIDLIFITPILLMYGIMLKLVDYAPVYLQLMFRIILTCLLLTSIGIMLYLLWPDAPIVEQL